MIIDKRDECGCHHGCTILPHDCESPCMFPDCLAETERNELAESILKDGNGRIPCERQ